MMKLSVLLLAVITVASNNNFSNAKMFHFSRVQGERNFNFDYTLDNGEKFIGTAIPLHMFSESVYVMMGANDSFYWVNFSKDDLSKDSFDKVVNYVQLDRENDSLAHLMDDFVSYYINKDGKLFGGMYDTDWDLDNVAFQLTSITEQTFNYVIISRNNGRQHRNVTSYSTDAHVQKVFVPDRHECLLYQATFTDDEFISTQTIYKQLDESALCEVPTPPSQAYAPGAAMEIDPNLLKSLAG